MAIAGAQGHNQRCQAGERAVHRHTCTRWRALQRQSGIGRGQGHRAEVLIHTRHDAQRQRQGYKARCAERQLALAREHFHTGGSCLGGLAIDACGHGGGRRTESDVRPIRQQHDVHRLALVTANDVDLSLPALIAIEHGFHTVNACLERQVHQRCRPQGQLIQNDLAAGGLRGDGHRAGKGGKANIELLGIGIAHRNGLLVGVIPLGVNRERVVPRSHQKPFSKGPVQSTQ